MSQRMPLGSLLITMGPIWQTLSARRRRQLAALFAMSVLSAGAEVANLGALLPFLRVLADPGQSIAALGGWAEPLASLGRLQLLVILGCGFLLVIGISSVLRVGTIVTQLRLTALIGADISQGVLSCILKRPYRWHLNNNSAHTIGILSQDISNVVDTIQGLLSIGINGILVSLMITALLGIAPLIMSWIMLTLGLWYVLIFRFIKAGLQRDGETLSRNNQGSIQTAQEALGGIRDILLNRSQSVFLNQFDRLNRAGRLAYSRIIIRAQVPRYLIEGFTLAIIVVVSLALSWRGQGVERQLPLLGTLALGTYRVLQPLQVCFGSLSAIQSHQVSCERVIADLERPAAQRSGSSKPLQKASARQPQQPGRHNAPLVQLEAVDFRYGSRDSWILRGVDLNITSGQRIGLVGGTGGGKSTLIDLILGLLEPTAGRVLIDGVDLHANPQQLSAWQRRVAHVPQHIHLSDGSFAENIAFGITAEAIHHERLIQAAEQACIAEMITQQPLGFATVVGERGLRLSGGQRQRLGLARALYRQAEVLILDEATSALDNLTEHQVMEAIEALTRTHTVILIAHRLSTVRHCDTIHLLQGGGIQASGSYAELEHGSQAFQTLLRHQVSR